MLFQLPSITPPGFLLHRDQGLILDGSWIILGCVYRSLLSAFLCPNSAFLCVIITPCRPFFIESYSLLYLLSMLYWWKRDSRSEDLESAPELKPIV